MKTLFVGKLTTNGNDIYTAPVALPLNATATKLSLASLTTQSGHPARRFYIGVYMTSLATSGVHNLILQPSQIITFSRALKCMMPAIPVTIPETSTGEAAILVEFSLLKIGSYSLAISLKSDLEGDSAVNFFSVIFSEGSNDDGGVNVTSVLGAAPIAKADIITGDGNPIIVNNGKVAVSNMPVSRIGI
ncbi:MAG: hypothetical protein WC464_05695 [Bdellovibrionales bacterium]